MGLERKISEGLLHAASLRRAARKSYPGNREAGKPLSARTGLVAAAGSKQ